MDYGFNVKLGKNIFINYHAVFLDTCLISIGSRTLVGPNVAFYSAMHPVDPTIRHGTRGPELGKEIHVGEDCWIGGNVVILPGVTIGKGSTVGAGSVVTKNVPEFTIVAGNPARIIRKVDTAMDPTNEAKWSGWPEERAEGGTEAFQTPPA
jgi:acetyltransferase-like isoleucine patch superfamily enzyme